MYRYKDTEIEKEREERGKNYCTSNGITYDLASLVVEGRVMTPPDKLSPLTSPDLGRYGESLIFAVNVHYELRFATDGGNRSPERPGLVKHETLFHNEDALAAGEIQFRDGVVVNLNDASGTYNPTRSNLLEDDPRFARAVSRAFARAGVEVDASLKAHLQSKAGSNEHY